MTERFLILIPPSQSKATGGRRSQKRGSFDDALDVPRRQVLDALASFLDGATPQQCATTFNAKGPLLERAVAAARAVTNADVPKLPAWKRYDGVVWTHLSPASLEPSQRRSVLVPSALYGLVASDDPIGDYRLKMSASLASIGTLARFWRPSLSSLLEERAKNKTIVNLLPQEHAASMDFAVIAKRRRVIHVHFVAPDDQRAVGHDAKAVKGVLARRVLDDGDSAFENFSWQGWSSRREGDDAFVTAPR